MGGVELSPAFLSLSTVLIGCPALPLGDVYQTTTPLFLSLYQMQLPRQQEGTVCMAEES